MTRNGVRLVAPCGRPLVVCAPVAAALASSTTSPLGGGAAVRLVDPRHPRSLWTVGWARRGILYPARLPTFDRLPPPERVAALVRWFWIPQWRIEPGRSSRQHIIG